MEFLRKAKENKWLVVRHWLVAPIIYIMFIPFAVLDLCMEIYHRITFPVYGIPYVKRSDYIRIDRHKLEYLNGLERFDCMYCGYVNGLVHYISVIVGETERYWCGIQHHQGDGFKNPKHHDGFLPYDDRVAFKEFLEK